MNPLCTILCAIFKNLSSFLSLTRQLATRMEIPLITTLTAAQAAVNGIRSLGQRELKVRSLQEHYAVGVLG